MISMEIRRITVVNVLKVATAVALGGCLLAIPFGELVRRWTGAPIIAYRVLEDDNYYVVQVDSKIVTNPSA